MVLGVAIYILLWWLAFFVMLPLGVRSFEEAGVEPAPGSDRGAPAAPNLLRKLLYAAALAAVIWAIGFLLFYFEVISIRPA